MSRRPGAIIALEDGTVMRGESFGAEGEVCAEVVFNTSMTGYQEILTDPSYRGQMIAMTCPHIGNVGVNPQDNESRRVQAAALLAHEIETTPSSWRATESLPEWLRAQNVIAIGGIDTRALTRRLRDRGVMKGIVSTTDDNTDRLVAKARAWEGLDGRDLVREVTCEERYAWDEATLDDYTPFARDLNGKTPEPSMHVVAYDFGIKLNILRRLTARGCRVSVVPAGTGAREALALKPDGIFLSNGPGDPAALPHLAQTTLEFLDAKIPLFGICLGHQILGLAIGARTYKLKFGHHGGNHPVQHLGSGRIAVTAQNHNYAVDPDSLDPSRVEITHRSLNDDCVEGMRLKDRPAFSVQYHPESSPGPHDSDDLFGQFIRAMRAVDAKAD